MAVDAKRTRNWKSNTIRALEHEPIQARSENDMPVVKVKENESFEQAMRRFKKTCEKAGILTELRRREFYEKPTQERKRKKAAAVKRHLKRISRETARRKRLY